MNEKHGPSRNVLVLLALYIGVWLPVLYLMPEALARSNGVQSFVKTVAGIVPPINVYAANSPDRFRVALFMAIHWSLFPTYIYLAFRHWAYRYRGHELLDRSSRRRAVLFGLLMILVAGGLMLLPTSMPLDDSAIRPSRIWRNWMHESLLPNGIIAVVLPLATAGFLLAAWLLFKISQIFSQKNRSKE